MAGKRQIFYRLGKCLIEDHLDDILGLTEEGHVGAPSSWPSQFPENADSVQNGAAERTDIAWMLLKYSCLTFWAQ